jgi:hypothetical protein
MRGAERTWRSHLRISSTVQYSGSSQSHSVSLLFRYGNGPEQHTSSWVWLGWEHVASPDCPRCGSCDHPGETYIPSVYVVLTQFVRHQEKLPRTRFWICVSKLPLKSNAAACWGMLTLEVIARSKAVGIFPNSGLFARRTRLRNVGCWYSILSSVVI